MAKKKKAKQNEFSGMETPRFEDLDEAAEEYKDGRDARQKATKREVDLKKNLIALMQSHELTRYLIPETEPPEEIVLLAKDIDVKVRKVKEDKPDEVTLDDVEEVSP